MVIELQCSNCGTRLSLNPTDFWKYGWRYTGVPYCSKCVKTWKERNGKEWNEQYNEELMKDIFYQYLFDKISSKKLDSERYVIYENKESLYEKLKDIYNRIHEIKMLFPKCTLDFINEGEALNHCVGRMGYNKKMANGESLIIFIMDIKRSFFIHHLSPLYLTYNQFLCFFDYHIIYYNIHL